MRDGYRKAVNGVATTINLTHLFIKVGNGAVRPVG